MEYGVQHRCNNRVRLEIGIHHWILKEHHDGPALAYL